MVISTCGLDARLVCVNPVLSEAAADQQPLVSPGVLGCLGQRFVRAVQSYTVLGQGMIVGGKDPAQQPCSRPESMGPTRLGPRVTTLATAPRHHR